MKAISEMPQSKQHEKKVTNNYAQQSMVGQLPKVLPLSAAKGILAYRLWLPCRRPNYCYEPRATHANYACY